MFDKSIKKLGRLTKVFLSACALQTPTFQNLHSRSAGDFLEKEGYPNVLREHFNIENIRFYSRPNPLKVWHKICNLFALVAYDDDMSFISKACGVPIFSLYVGLSSIKDARDNIRSSACMSVGQTKYIDPTGNFSLNEFLAKMSQIKPLSKIKKLHTINKPEDLVKAFKTFITAHEMRHCEQPEGWKNVRAESDSDIVAAQLLAQSDYSQSLLEEATKIILAVRATASFRSHTDHDTVLSLQSGVAEIEHNAAYDDVRHRVLDLLDKQGYRHFFTRISRDEKQYHATSFLLSSGEFPKGGDSERYATLYKWAFEYLDELSGGALIKHPDYAATFAQARGNEEKGVAPFFPIV